MITKKHPAIKGTRSIGGISFSWREDRCKFPRKLKKNPFGWYVTKQIRLYDPVGFKKYFDVRDFKIK